jgi:hypothetical protein
LPEESIGELKKLSLAFLIQEVKKIRKLKEED